MVEEILSGEAVLEGAAGEEVVGPRLGPLADGGVQGEVGGAVVGAQVVVAAQELLGELRVALFEGGSGGGGGR